MSAEPSRPRSFSRLALIIGVILATAAATVGIVALYQRDHTRDAATAIPGVALPAGHDNPDLTGQWVNGADSTYPLRLIDNHGDLTHAMVMPIDDNHGGVTPEQYSLTGSFRRRCDRQRPGHARRATRPSATSNAPRRRSRRTSGRPTRDSASALRTCPFDGGRPGLDASLVPLEDRRHQHPPLVSEHPTGWLVGGGVKRPIGSTSVSGTAKSKHRCLEWTELT